MKVGTFSLKAAIPKQFCSFSLVKWITFRICKFFFFSLSHCAFEDKSYACFIHHLMFKLFLTLFPKSIHWLGIVTFTAQSKLMTKPLNVTNGHSHNFLKGPASARLCSGLLEPVPRPGDPKASTGTPGRKRGGERDRTGRRKGEAWAALGRSQLLLVHHYC